MIDPRLGELLSSLDFPMDGVWSQEALPSAQGRVLTLGTLTLQLPTPVWMCWSKRPRRCR